MDSFYSNILMVRVNGSGNTYFIEGCELEKKSPFDKVKPVKKAPRIQDLRFCRAGLVNYSPLS